MICKKCGKSIPDNARICRYCNSVQGSVPHHSPKAAPAPVRRPQSATRRPAAPQNVRPAANAQRPATRSAQRAKPKKNTAKNTVIALLIVCLFLIIIVGAIFISSLGDLKGTVAGTDTTTAVPEDDVVVITFGKDTDEPDVTVTDPTSDATDETSADETATESTEETTEPPETSGGPSYPVVAPPEVSGEPTTFFDDAAFIGDSVSLKLSYYAMNGSIGSPTFLTRGSYSMCHAAWNSMYLTYQGMDLSIEDAIDACGAKKVFIMLGMNDIGAYGIDKTIEHWEMVMDRINESCPDVDIYIQSCTPIYSGGERGSLTNANMDAFNERLESFADEHGYYYIDVATYMKDANGGLAVSYCSDEYVHLTDAGVETWIKVLKDFVANH